MHSVFFFRNYNGRQSCFVHQCKSSEPSGAWIPWQCRRHPSLRVFSSIPQGLCKWVTNRQGQRTSRSSYSLFFSYNDSPNSVQKMWIGERASLAVAEAIGRDRYFSARTPLTDLKAIKNAIELEGFRQSHIRDGIALARYFAWLEAQLNNGVVLNESQGADQLEKFRSSVFSLFTLIEKCSWLETESWIYSKGFLLIQFHRQDLMGVCFIDF